MNFAHLRHLTQRIAMAGDSVAIVHIYSEYPDYGWVDASEEGISCVDDVARAAVLYLRYAQLTGDRRVLPQAKAYLRFLLHMQRPDGLFYNFIRRDGSINRRGRTSKASFDWWAVRGYEALAYGIRAFAKEDSAFSARLRRAFLLCRKPLARVLSNYPRKILWSGKSYPAWLVHETAADASAVLLHALTLFLQIQPDAELQAAALRLAEGIRAMQLPDTSRFPGLFLSFRDLWHAWGNIQAYALAAFGQIQAGDSLAAAARFEARAFLPRLLLGNWFAEYYVSRDSLVRFPQIAYGVRCAALGALAVYRSSGEVRYARLAGLLASWLTGNNPAGQPLYDPGTGRGYDGVTDSLRINRNAGAESTIETLRTLVEIQAVPEARAFLMARFTGKSRVQEVSGWGRSAVRPFVVPGRGGWQLVYSLNKKDFRILRESQ